jgi:cardiolipin synthase
MKLKLPGTGPLAEQPRRRRFAVIVLAAGVIAFAVLVVTAIRPVPPTYEVLPALSIEDPVFASTLEAHLTTPIVGGNRVTLLLNGDEIFPAKLAMIRGARTSINYAEYFWGEGAVGKEIAEALAERCRAGVAVKVLLDAVGTFNMPDEHRGAMLRAGCRVHTFRPLVRWSLRRHNNRNHRRVLVVDGRFGHTGGSGVNDKWTGNGLQEGHWRDTDLQIDGPGVLWLQAAFVENWREATREVLGGAAYFPPPSSASGEVRVQVVSSSPVSGTYASHLMLLLAMTAAQRTIYITNPYFVLDERMTGALLAARRRGVRVVALTPGKIDHNLVRAASRHDFGRLLEGGVEIYEYQASLLHSKTLVVDATWATIGSTNLDNRSFALNDELNVGVFDRTLARRLQDVFERDLQRARRVTLEAWKKRGLKERMLETLVLPVRDLL